MRLLSARPGARLRGLVLDMPRLSAAAAEADDTRPASTLVAADGDVKASPSAEAAGHSKGSCAVFGSGTAPLLPHSGSVAVVAANSVGEGDEGLEPEEGEGEEAVEAEPLRATPAVRWNKLQTNLGKLLTSGSAAATAAGAQTGMGGELHTML